MSTRSSFRILLPLGIALCVAPANGDPGGHNIVSPVVVSEIMYAPQSGAPEWVELTNVRNDTLDLSGWQISDANVTSRHTFSTTFSGLPPGESIVLGRDAAAFVQAYPSAHCRFVSVPGFPSLNNGGDIIVLYAPDGSVADSVAYLSSWGASGNGASLERIDCLGPSNDPRNWRPSLRVGGTPGAGNSVGRQTLDAGLRAAALQPAGSALCVTATIWNAGRDSLPEVTVSLLVHDSLVASTVHAGLSSGDSAQVILCWEAAEPGMHMANVVVRAPADTNPANDTLAIEMAVPHPPLTVVINEIMMQPPATGCDYVELYNASRTPVSMTRWRLHDGTTAADRERRGMLADTSLVLEPGRYLLVAHDSSVLVAFPSLVQAGMPGPVLCSTLTLSNIHDEIVLHDASGAIIDSVSYNSSWHNPALVDPTGRSLERVNPLLPSNDPANWASSLGAQGGTPGRPNTVSVDVVCRTSRLACSPNPFSPDDDGIDDRTAIHFECPLRSAVASMVIYNIRGRRVRTLVDHQPAGPEGMAIWDGRDDDGRVVPMGIYVVHVQVGAARGASSEAKATVVVARRL